MKALSAADTPFIIQLSFDRIIENLEALALSLKGERAIEAQQLLNEISLVPELKSGIKSMALVEQHESLINRLLADYFPEVLTLNEIKAVSIPYRNIIFNHTERFKSILKSAGDDFDINIRGLDEHQFYVMSCCIILNEFYGTQLDFSRPLFYDIPSANGIVKHYRILYNADFLDILPTEKSVKLSEDDIDLLLNNYDNLELWKEKFPKESWILKGFAIITLFDATIENAVSLFKEKLLVLNVDGFQQSVESIFRSIFGIPDLKIGFTVFKKEEERFSIAEFGQKMRSFILSDGYESASQEVLCVNSYRALVQEKTYFAVSDTAEFYGTYPESYLGKKFLSQQINSFILAPVVKDDVLLGVLEIISPRAKLLNSINANKLDVVMVFLTDAVDRLMSELQHQIQAFIQDKYTTIHASVYWRFREEAQQAIYGPDKGEGLSLNEIVFPDLYPLYGQVDIKGSSESRNLSVQYDLQNQVASLLELLTQLNEQDIKNNLDHSLFAEERSQLSIFIGELSLPLKANTEQYITNYIESHIHTLLEEITSPKSSSSVTAYFKNTGKETGEFHIYRRKYESTVSMINNKLAAIIDEQQEEAQSSFPHYYERFKTDGVEHNLYIGSSIAPSQVFNLNKLFYLRLWQIRVLCEMEIAHYQLLPLLPYPLEVATLILVYSTPIAIRFRMDEKRFDVDGTYNARFEIVKKRIDKARIKDSEERITEAGKITIVYSNDIEEAEYTGYIQTLQLEGILENVIENFEVEDLQGISGMRALRVSIIH